MRLTELLDKNRIQCKSNICDVHRMAEHKLYLYGAGHLGKPLGQTLSAAGVPVAGYIDRRAKELRATGMQNVYTLTEAAQNCPKDCAILLAALFTLDEEASVRHDLQQVGFSRVYALRELDWKSFPSDTFRLNIFKAHYDPARFVDDEPQILRAYELFHSEAERHFFLTQIEAYRTLDWSIFPAPLPIHLQYTAHDIPESLDMRVFFDCGAYDGDTLRALHKAGMKLEKYIAFEPQTELFAKIHTSAVEAGIHCIAYPAGLAAKTQILYFESLNDSPTSSHVSTKGSPLPCIALDEAFCNFSPTFIKMDIEGMEVEALRGAENLIRKYHPQLAICVYHDLAHMWQIPLLLHEYYSGYRFYLRNYQVMGLETVVYAFA